LKRAGGVKPDAYLPSVQITRLNPDSSQRMVSAALRDTLGTVVQDLRLESNDEIRVFSLSDYRTSRYVVVSGAVKIGGRIPYREGMTLREALLQVGGLQESASLTEAEVAHMPEDRRGGALAVTERVPLDSTYLFERGADGRYLGPPGLSAPASRAPEVTLKPYDNVLILQQPDWSLPRTAYIGGEVRYPGTYTLLSTSERLTDLIQRAGGFTPRAYPDAATFTRQTGNAGRVSIDLPAVVKDANNIDNVALVDRDSLVVPAYIPLVTVRGEVYLPVSTAFVKGARLDYYIQSAGGGTVKAETSRSYVIQPNGRVETRSTHLGLWTSNPVPQPGSTVVIPAKDPNDKRDWLQATAAFTSLLGSLVAIAAIVRR
jgi:polysaccharide export outer membrane protein